eukprot:TRINITY_DN23171_c0_g1_i1.p1 TRINITY_DN23171_c0_g1~~TRINITY_DN23171_c0_g1_i1.p1  ORF type:complete len:501 (+),score=131.71 TRINITY_DN23171_c0_g1_i1:40-1542(+)
MATRRTSRTPTRRGDALCPGVVLKDHTGRAVVCLEAKIGRGGCGEAWKARHMSDKIGACVVKISHRAGGTMMQREKQMLELLHSKARSNILSALEVFRGSDGREYLVTEYCEFGDFRKEIRTRIEKREDMCERYNCDELVSLLLYYVGGYCRDFHSAGQQILAELNAVVDSPQSAQLVRGDLLQDICSFADEPSLLTAGRLLAALHRRMPYVVYERCSGLSESEVEADYWCIVRQLLCALDCAHSLGVMHRDMKWENVFLARGNTVVLGDFGVADLIDAGVTCAKLVDGGELPIGTTAFLPPEAIDGVFGPPGDIWALGIMMHELCLARHPFLPNLRARKLLLPQLFQKVTAAEGLYSMRKLYDLGIIRGLTWELCEFVDSMLHVDSKMRPSAATLLSHPHFGEMLLHDWETVLGEARRSGGEISKKCIERLRNITRDLHAYHGVSMLTDSNLLSRSTLSRARQDLESFNRNRASSASRKLKRDTPHLKVVSQPAGPSLG